MKVIYHEVKRGKGPKYGARKYGQVESDTNPGTFYDVAKVRDHFRPTYSYQCQCADFIFRNNRNCKHIAAFKARERKG